MEKKLYEAMNWREIEAIIYAESTCPHQLLSAHKMDKSFLVQAYFPNATSVNIVSDYEEKNAKKVKTICMEMVDEAGYFAQFLPKNMQPVFHYEVTYPDGVKQMPDIYAYQPDFSSKTILSLQNGTLSDAYQFLGAHKAIVQDTEGIAFAVWAPNALSVSVVGDFNNWNGCLHQMSILKDSGIFTLFVPGLTDGCEYQYEIKCKGARIYRKSDPYAVITEGETEKSSIYTSLPNYAWSDQSWLLERKNKSWSSEPLNICRISTKNVFRNVENTEEETKRLVQYLCDMSYTHVELTDCVTNFYAINACIKQPEAFMRFVDYCHQNNIGVLLDWTYAYFTPDPSTLMEYDGTCLYEHLDPRRGVHPKLGTLMFQHKRPQVASFLKSCAAYWLDIYHVDGFRFMALADMLYLDYGRIKQQWIPNKDGGNTDYDAIDFVREMNTMLSQTHAGVIKIADLDALWEHVTTPVKKGGLGFDFQWNHSHTKDMMDYMSYDPYFRAHHHDELILSMAYGYNEKFITPICVDELDDKDDFLLNMPCKDEDCNRNLRLFYAYMMMHPGKKVWNISGASSSGSDEMQTFLKDMNDFYLSHPSLFEYDNIPKGFRWVYNMSANECVVSFERYCDLTEESLFIVANFANVTKEKFTTGVLRAGKYREIFNTELISYGGSNLCNQRAIASKEQGCNGMDESITLKLPALGLLVFSYTPFTDKELQKIELRKEQERLKKAEELRLEEEKKQRLAEFEVLKQQIMEDAIREANLKIEALEKNFHEEEKRLTHCRKEKK